MSDIDEIIEHGIVFKGASKGGSKDDDKVKTKAKKKKYITAPDRPSRKPSTGSNGPTELRKGKRNKLWQQKTTTRRKLDVRS